ncbi:hypothetical protein GCM10023185_11700 [Hymenobacter saemangeumensis]|uniref:Ig-like domain-containing protein n=1 Tax=Hymenobacter saemangeumensis TaxID=1084522 RepID=A0ABP8I6A7_9BACT
MNPGSGTTYYDLNGTTQNTQTINPDFNGGFLGTFAPGATLVFQGGQLKTFKNSGCDVINARMHYRVYPAGLPGGSFTAINLPFDQNLPTPGDQQWTSTSSTANLLNGLAAGDYTVEVYGSSDYQFCGNGTNYYSDGGTNYRASFRVANAATTVLTETFEAGSSFTLVNGSADNTWVRGTVAGGASNALYISNDGGSSYAYSGANNGNRSQVHAYTDVTVGAGQTIINLAFQWKNIGENTFDYLRVSYAPTTFTPSAVSNASLAVGTPISGTGTGTPVILADNLNGQSAFTSRSIVLPSSLAGSTFRLIFSWINDGSVVANPPAAFDNVTVTSQAPNPICGIKSVGPSGDFASLTQAFSTINANGICGPLVLELLSSYSSSGESFPLVFSYAGTTSTNTVTVRPRAGATGLSISSTAAQTLNISGTSYFILDGRPGGSGSLVSGPAQNTDLLIANTSTSGSPLVFSNDASFNTVQHCRVQGVGTASTAADIAFSSTATAGNSDNIIRFNTIGSGATTPTTLIYSGSSTNARNTIQGNELQNFYSSSGDAYGIFLSAAGSGWSIRSNSLFWTAARNGVGSSTLYGINIAGGSSGCTIEDNFIGGTAASAGGTPMTISGSPVSYRFRGISLAGSGTAASIQNNTIANFAWLSSSGATTAPGIWTGMYLLSNANVGTDIGNTIGTSSGGVVVTSSTGGGISYGIVSSAGPSALLISQNTISNLRAAGTTTSIPVSFAGIQTAGSSNTISRNRIYDLTAGNNGTATGIIAFGGSSTEISNNLIGDLKAPTASNLLAVSGITVSGGSAVTLYYNTIYLNASSSAATFGSSGIYASSTTTSIDLRNNLTVNNSAPGSGNGLSVALRRASTTLGTYASTSDTNLYYAGTPAANRLIYYDGTNSDQTMAAFKTRVAPREAGSVTENVAFVSTTGTAAGFLHIDPSVPTLVESRGAAIAGLTDDYDALNTRPAGGYPLAGQTNGGGSAPDLGADEGNFTPLPVVDVGITALAAPAASQACFTTNETVSVTLRNFASTPLNLATNPVTVSGTITAPGFTTVALPSVVLSSGTLAGNASQTVTFPGTYDLSVPNTYTFNISATATGDVDPTNDALPAGNNTRVVQPLAAGTASASPAALCGTGNTTTLTLSGNSGGNVQWQTSPDNLTFTAIGGATSTSYTTPPLSQTTYYRAVVSCGANSQTSNVVTVTVSDPQITAVNSPSRCGAGSVTLTATATAGDTPYYYTTATGGVPFASGSSATVTVSATPSTQTYYVEARTGTLNVAGEQSNSSAPSGSVFQQSTFTDYPLGFNVLTAGTLTSVDVYPSAAGTLTIRLYTATNPGAGTAVAGSDRTFTITAGQVGTRVTLPLYYSLAAGGYKLSNFAGTLGRYSTYTGTYPLTNGALSVVGSYNFFTSTSYSNTTYNSFFNLGFAPGSSGCASTPRTAINVTVTPAPALPPVSSAQTICSGASTSITYSGYSNLTVSPTTGATVSGQTITFNPTSTTTYTVTGNDGTGPTGCSATATATITVNPAPNAPALTPSAPAPICVGTSTTVTASSNTDMQSNRPILTASFDTGTDGFTATSTGSQVSSGFTRVAAGYLRGTANTPYNGPSGASTGGYFISDSDKYGSGATSPSTQTTLLSPSFSTVNYTAATLSFQHYYRRIAADVAVIIEYSTNGSTWTSLVSYTATQGTGSGTEATTAVALPAAALGQSNVQIRFRYQTDNGWYWAIDNVSIAGSYSEAPTFAVSPTTGATVSGSTITFNPTTTTTYSVTAQYASTGCTSPVTPVTITVNPRPTAAFSSGSTFTTCSGTSTTLTGTLTGTAPFTGEYTVNGGTPQPLSISGNTFSIATGTLTANSTFAISALSDANCSATTLPAASATITVNPRPTFTISGVTHVNCFGSSSGSITVAASGGLSPYRYSKDNGATYQVSNTFTGLAAGTYQILVRSNAGALCTAVASQSVTITQPTTGVAVSATRTNVSCTNANDGSITATGSMGAGPYRYSIDNGSTFLPGTPTATPYTFTGLDAGSYTVLVLDANGCTASTPITITTTNPRPTASLSNNGPLCAGNPATVTVNLTGTGPWNLTYTNGSTSTTVSGISSSPYTINVPLLLNTTTYSVTALSDAFCTGAGSGLGSTTIMVNTTTTWTGTASSGDPTDWFNSDNWTNCIPTRFVNAVIPNGALNYPELLTTATAEVNTLIVNNGASFYQAAGQLHIYGNLNNSGFLDIAPIDGLTGNRVGPTLAILGPGPHMINGLGEVLHLAIDTGSGTTSLSPNLSVYGSLTMTSGLLSTGSSTITLRDIANGPYSTAPLVETETSYVLGRISVIRDLSTAGASDSFNGLGLTLTPNAASTTLPGITQVTRTTGTVVLGVNNNQSILRQFRIIPQNDEDLNVNMLFGYFDHERNGYADANLMLFSRDLAATGATPWMYYRASLGTATPPNGTNVGTVAINGLSSLLQDWTVGSSLSPLPVELTRFEARRLGDAAELSWATASEKNNRGFEVQVSANGRDFRALHFLASASPNSLAPRSYSYSDRESGKTGLRYYRLRQVDLDGTASFSPVRTVLFDQPHTSLSAAPNPFRQELQVSVQLPAAQAATLTLTDLAGRLVRERKVQLPAGTTTLQLQDLGSLPTGVYLLRLLHAGAPQMVKVVKE